MEFVKGLAAVPKKTWYYGGAALFVIVASIIGAVIWKSGNKPVVAEEITLVRTAVVESRAAAEDYTYSGEVRGRYESKLAFQVNGKITQRHVQLGSAVKAGDTLMQIDAKDIVQIVNNHSAMVDAAESQLQLADSNLKRYKELLDDGAVSRAQYEQYLNAYKVAVAGVRQARAQYAQGANQLEYSLLKADKAGIVASITAEVGQVVSAGQVVVTVVEDGEREVEISVPENRMQELRNAKSFMVTLWALDDIMIDGKVREIAPVADPITRTFKVRIHLLKAPPDLKLGMTATAKMASNDARQVVTIPLTAIYQNSETPAVWVVTDDTLALRPIKTGKISKQSTIEVLEGLQPGDRYVTKGVNKLRAGQRVQVSGESL